jgi:hypothetical protein
MSVNLDTAARVEIGKGSDSQSVAVTTSAADVTIPSRLRGKYVRMYASAGTCYLAFGEDATSANSLEVATGTPESIFIPTGSGDYVFSALGSEALTLKIVVASP